ncbi:hypothetical protein M378DRAFT_66554 [Amanita muscaria Koide BX008]|uniref:SGT1-domain-containing protein n=1 Tax=Amanita muscaria (strain Koide BX008) TaxID=946122 RepID=A0A0C2X9E3_AMAMK|nr:hypothetical protein M378DRAFT_66554 [Amanita muscaria Koide BX008]
MSTGLTISDVFSRQPAIAQDTLQYVLYPPQNLSDEDSVTAFAACILAFVDELLQDFIWHRDSFELKVVENPESDGFILQGFMRVGDSIDDEWSVVWLLKLISAKEDLAISVFDSDGEFLLIEAAEALPAWVEPSNSENRVWIYNSRLHLLPLSHISPPSRRKHRRKLPGRSESDDEDLTVEDDNEWISANDAANVIMDPFIDTFAPEAVEKLVWQRISGYPAALKDHVHVTKAWIPVDVAKALTTDLSLVQRAVEAFYTRDALELRSAHRMSRFPPDTSVLRPIRMTRTAYAQLVGQKFFPPKVFGRWQEKEATREWSWRDVGMKIAVGFEMLYQETKARHDAIETAESVKSSTDAKKDALRRDPHYVKYLQNLAATDYFKGEIQGSRLWQDLENKAVTVYINVRREDNASRPSFASQVKLAIAQISSLPEVPDHEDNDDWLNVDAQDFDELLEKTMGVSKAEQRKPSDEMDMDENKDDAEERLASAQATKLKELATKVEKFVEGEGDMEGARFEDENLSDEEFSDDEDIVSEDGEDSDEKAERRAAMDRLVPALDPSEYGRMPASFHSNSQRVAATTIKTDKAADNENQSSTDVSARERRIRPPILPRDNFEGVDSDDETDEESEDEESEEEKPQVVGEVEIDMAEEEEEFLEFSRQALGITDEHWNEIILDRKSRGAFLPSSAMAKPLKAKEERSNMPIARKEESDNAKASARAKSGVNPKLDSFEAVMKAMDEELARVRNASQKTAPSNSKGKGKAQEPSTEEGDDIEAAMEAELKASLERDEDEEDEETAEDVVDYNLIKNFLESFKSQEGLAGPVSSMAGRLQPEWKLPRDFGGSS